MSYNMTNVLGVLFSNAYDDTLPELTSNRAMGSVPFGGRFRLIDFALSNMSNSGISKVGVITKENYQSLLDHLGSGTNWDLARSNGGLCILPPYGTTTSGLYQGKLDALNNAMGYVNKSGCEYVLVCDCNVICNVDFSKIVNAHIDSGADITCVVHTGEYGREDTAISNVYAADNGKVKGVYINCAQSGKHTLGLSMYVMSKELLTRLLGELIPQGKCSFARDVLQGMVDELDIRTYEFDGYFSKISNLDSYYKESMALLDPDNLRGLVLPKRPVYTKVRDDAPSKYGLDSSVTNSLVADGCVIEGVVENSILFRGVKVAKGAVVKNSILMQDTSVGKHSQVVNIITDKQVTVGDNVIVSSGENCPLYIAKSRKV